LNDNIKKRVSISYITLHFNYREDGTERESEFQYCYVTVKPLGN